MKTEKKMIKSRIILNKNYILHHQTRPKHQIDFCSRLIDIGGKIIKEKVLSSSIIKGTKKTKM